MGSIPTRSTSWGRPRACPGRPPGPTLRNPDDVLNGSRQVSADPRSREARRHPGFLVTTIAGSDQDRAAAGGRAGNQLERGRRARERRRPRVDAGCERNDSRPMPSRRMHRRREEGGAAVDTRDEAGSVGGSASRCRLRSLVRRIVERRRATTDSPAAPRVKRLSFQSRSEMRRQHVRHEAVTGGRSMATFRGANLASCAASSPCSRSLC